MSETTTTTMSVASARARLSDSRGMGDEQINALQGIIARFHATRPQNRQCVACSCVQWEERSSVNGDSVWACAGCHRPATLTSAQWFADQKREREAADAHLRATEAAAPRPRVVLREALARLSDARTALSKCERALPAARAGVLAAQEIHDAATAALAEADAGAAEHVAASIFEGKRPGPATATAAARAALAQAVDGLVIARNARAILDSKLKDARSAVDYATNRAKKAAQAVIAAERLEPLLAKATEARAAYLESVGQLAWLVRSHAIQGDDARPREIVADANTPPSAWPDAASAGDRAMAEAMAALLDEPRAT